MAVDLFGNEIIEDVLLRDIFIEPPFSVLDTKTGSWQKRKRQWMEIGIKSEIGRKKCQVIHCETNKKDIKKNANYISIFDPSLCEVIYHWFCPKNGKILDPFSGGSVRGIVANYLGYKYTGIDIRQEQIDCNREQALDILPVNNQPNWYVGDSNKILDDKWLIDFDFILSCPPYGNLEVYSKLDDDISNMSYDKFLIAYESIIKKSCQLLKVNGLACFVVGDFRDKKGNYYGFVADTIKIFQKVGMKYYNEAILLNSLASAPLRSRGNMKNKKLVKVHQNILVFRKSS